jgi:signal transduction histidine kinase
MNLFGLSSIILSLSGLIFSFIVFRSEMKNRINQLWFISCVSFSIWSYSLYVVTSTPSLSYATFWQYILDISAIFLPATYFLFLIKFLGYERKILKWIPILVASLFSIFSLTPFFKEGMGTFGDFFWVEPGRFYIIFPIYFVVYATISVSLLVLAYRKSPKGSDMRSQVRNMILGGIMGYGGGVTNFFPQVFSIYPFGNYLVIFYIVFMVYGVIRYKLLSAKVISAQLFSTALALTSLIGLLRSDTLTDIFLNLLIFVLVILFSLLLISSVNKEVRQRERIELLAKDLQKANDRLTDLDRQKSEFVSFATHQLRAPLTAMKGYASLILEGDMGAITDATKEAIGRIFESTKTLTNIVDDYLNITRIELGSMKYAFETISLKGLIEDVIAELKPNIEKSKLDFSFNVDMPAANYRVTADRDKLKQVIANLIDNSMKYTPSGWVKVRLDMDKARHKFLFTVSDSGIGIAPETIPLLFQKFGRAHNANKVNIKGTGLGLFVAKEILNAHNASIKVESPGEGKGSVFTVEFEPFAKA